MKRHHENGMIYPYVLLLFMVVNMLVFFGRDILISNQQTAANLADYYEVKIMEMMVLQKLLPLLEAGEGINGRMETNRGSVIYSAVPQGKESDLMTIVLRTNNEQSSNLVQFIYNKKQKQIIKRSI